VTTLLDDPTLPEESFLLDVLERYADLVDEIRLVVQDRRSGGLTWEGMADRLAVCSWGRLLRRWRHAVRPDRPPYSLVVRLAKVLPELLRQVTASPKRVLRREREREPLHRIREFDSTCMRWVCRQPGVTLAEKAGHQRSLLAVRRFESINTLENRVVLTLVRRSVRLCRDYLRQHGEAFAGHERVLGVKALSRQCRRLLEDPMFVEVAQLESIPTPNYVLLHDDRYHLLWRLFLLVMRRQRRRQVLWLNRYSLLREMLIVAANEYLSRAASQVERKAGLRYDVVLLSNPYGGGFLDVSCEPPFWDGRMEAPMSPASCTVREERDDCFVVKCEKRDEQSISQSSEHTLPVDLMIRCDEHFKAFLGKVQ
jgi:hypothetical protein